jgi:hypothetical protein
MQFFDLLRPVPSLNLTERRELMTGVTAASGTNATSTCADPPTVGQGKVCEINYEWGEYKVKTKFNTRASAGMLRDYSERNGVILNQGPDNHPFIPDIFFRMTNANSLLQNEFWNIGVAMQRSHSIVGIRGNSATASANTNHGWIAEYDGLDRLIKTGHTDAKTSVACPAADSIVTTFNAEVGGTIASPDGRNIVQAATDLAWSLQQRAMNFGMDGTLWAIVMRPEMFRAMVEVWACNYATYRCNSNSGGNTFTLNEDTVRTNDLRLEMMRGQYLLIDGLQWPVVFSEGITREGVGANHFKADMYFVPVSWQNTPLLTLEYFPLDNPVAAEYFNWLGADNETVLNNGMWAAGEKEVPFCKEYHFYTKQRLILETPHLAGRIDDVRFTFRANPRLADPADTWYYADGGKTYQT